MTAPNIPDQKAPITLDLGDGETITFVHVPAGKFIFQPDNEMLKQGYSMPEFYLQQTPMTQGQYLALMGENPSENKGRSLPVTNLSWLDIYESDLFDKVRSQLRQKISPNWTCRLPNEVEWEYAASFGNTAYAGSNHPMPVAWTEENADVRAMPVGSRLSNPLGLYDLSGNVWEWCHNRDEGHLNQGEMHHPLPNEGERIALRGGSFWSLRYNAHVRRRYDEHASYRLRLLSLRLSLAPPALFDLNKPS